MKKLLTLIISLLPISTFALGLINDFEWLEPNNSVEVVVGEPYQLKFNCSDNSLPFTSDYSDYWNHYDFDGGQHMVSIPTGYSIDDKGVITGLVPGSYAIKFTGYILAKDGAEKMLMVTVVSERSETEPNNTFDTSNDIDSKIRFGLFNTSDIDFFKFTNSNLKWGDNVTFKIHYYGFREEPFGYKWSTFCGADMSGSGSLISQDQECKAIVTSGNTVYLEVYYDQSRTEYFNYGEEFVAEIYINGIPANEYGNDVVAEFEGEGTADSPFMIKTATNLKELANFVNSGNQYADTYFELGGNIDLTGETFDPIGNQNNHFSGIFDGKGYIIKGISANAEAYVGLFGYIDNAIINDVGIEEADIRGWSYIGGIAGYSQNSTITNCFTRGTTNGNDCVGALVGYSDESTIIRNSFSSMQHTKYEIYGSVGGLVGYNCGQLENSVYYGTINAKIFEKSSTGGIVGYNHTTGAIHYCYFIKYGDVMNGEFSYCGSLNWGDCYGIDSFDIYGMTTSGYYLHAQLNTWVTEHSHEGSYRKWTEESFPSFSGYAESLEPQSDNEFVDLGLPSGILWATTNLGAKRPEETGYYYAWGETTPNKSLYDATTYIDPNVSNISGTEYDAAYTTSGGKCRIPTYDEFLELINYCTWEYTQVNSINGYKVIGENGNSIFLPFVGGKEDGYNVGYSEYGYSGQGFYVSGTAFPYDSAYNWYLYMDTDPRFGMYGYNKTRGQTIRPVQNLPSHIDGITNDNSATSTNIYTLDGRLVLKNANLKENTKTLPRGIYVINGKKIVVK